jgi:hypothetical protein
MLVATVVADRLPGGADPCAARYSLPATWSGRTPGYWRGWAVIFHTDSGEFAPQCLRLPVPGLA